MVLTVERPTKPPTPIVKLRIAVVLLPFFIIYGFIHTRGAPLAPRLVGIAVSLFLEFWLISVLRRTKSKR
jgi:hypothetical protein